MTKLVAGRRLYVKMFDLYFIESPLWHIWQASIINKYKRKPQLLLLKPIRDLALDLLSNVMRYALCGMVPISVQCELVAFEICTADIDSDAKTVQLIPHHTELYT